MVRLTPDKSIDDVGFWGDSNTIPHQNAARAHDEGDGQDSELSLQSSRRKKSKAPGGRFKD